MSLLITAFQKRWYRILLMLVFVILSMPFITTFRITRPHRMMSIKVKYAGDPDISLISFENELPPKMMMGFGNCSWRPKYMFSVLNTEVWLLERYRMVSGDYHSKMPWLVFFSGQDSLIHDDGGNGSKFYLSASE